MLICRTERPLSEDVKRKIALFCNVEFGSVIESRDVPSIYEIPLSFHEQGLDDRVVDRLGLGGRKADLAPWREMVSRIYAPHGRVQVAVVGKYTDLVDSYKSVQEALIHGGIANFTGVDITWLSSDLFTTPERAAELLGEVDALLIPGGFGVRGIDGMVNAVRYAREKGLPFFGICLGMQVASIEFARNKCGLEDSHSSEFAPECGNPVISLMESQQHVTDMGGTMRLGAYPCRLKAGSLVAHMYGSSDTSERHRHRYEFSNAYREIFERHGVRFSGLSPDGSLVEMIEIPDHPWFVGCQFHPELRSRPTRPHPLFAGFIGAAISANQVRADERERSQRAHAAG
jgi:CTP synthase